MGDTKSPTEVKIQVSQLKEWVEKQPHLPKNIDDKLLLRFIHSNYYDMEKAKQTADLFFSLRASSPELLNDRDPHSPVMQKTLKIVNLAQYQTANRTNIWIWQLNDPGLDNYDYLQDARLFLLTTDAWLMKEQPLEESDVVILDVKDLSLKYLTKFNVSVARKLSKYQEDALPVRIKQIHVINTPPIIDKIFALMKPFLKQEMTEMIHFHTPKSETLYDFINKEDLPSDYGGSQASMDDYMEKSIQLIESQRDALKDDNLWRAEKKTKNKSEASIEVGSFRTLSID